MPECGGCEACREPSDADGVADDEDDGGSEAYCGGLVRERQVGLKCGKHAVNAVLANQNMPIATERELDARSRSIGVVSHGDDYDVSTLQFFLSVDRGLEVTQVGDQNGNARPVSQLLQEVGSLGSMEGLTPDERAAFERQRRVVDAETLPWVICNNHGHWFTYFHPGQSGDWCNLDSIPARQGIPAAQLTRQELESVGCKAIILPLS
jgi:hypothetical protein